MKKINLLYLIVVMFYLISGLIKWDVTTIFACVLSLILMFITNVIGKKLGFGNAIKILIYIFILGTEVLGEIYHFYVDVWWFDIVMHTYFAFIISYAGLYLIRYFKIKGSIYFVILFVFSFAMMTESVWEIFEFSMDRVIGTDMQKDTVIRNINSTYLSENIYVDKVMVNDIDFMDRYGGYLDIGLYDTISDMICTVVGSFMFIVIMKKRLNC